MELKLSALFSDGMVLQRGQPIPIEGKAIPSTEVTVHLAGIDAAATAGKDGRWQVHLPPLPAGGPYSMQILAGETEKKIKDILIGDVWLCCGQSNMELRMQRVQYMFPEEISQAENPEIRQFSVPHEYHCGIPSQEITAGCWQAVSHDTIKNFTAVGYFFAKRLYEQYGVPIGLLDTAVGGTPVHSWMGYSMLEDFPEEIAEAERWADRALLAEAEEQETLRLEKYYTQLDTSDKGLQEGWHLPAYDDSGWPSCQMEDPWPAMLLPPGSAWFRRKIHIPPQFAGKPAQLFLGTITDADIVYLNGRQVGETTYRYPPREYKIDALPAGECCLSIRVLNPYGDGCFKTHAFHLLVCEGKTINLNQGWRCNRGASSEKLAEPVFYYRKPTAFYSGMIAPLHQWPLCGAIWYQGESDTPVPQNYGKKLSAMIRGWRACWGHEFPFLMVQLAHYNDPAACDWDAIRRQQEEVVSSLPATALVYGFDAGEDNDLHPQNKQLVGRRLARAAMGMAYGEILPPSPFQLGPMLDEKAGTP